MSREILFRGKRVDNNQWTEGFLSFIYTDGRNSNGFIYTDKAQIYSPVEVRSHDVYTSTVGQFTGLCDKDGKKIFEGDIVKTHYANAVKSDFIETVVFHNGRFCANSKISETGEWWTSLADGVPHVSFDKSVYMESCKVIGNIHDTPDLAKEEAE